MGRFLNSLLFWRVLALFLVSLLIGTGIVFFQGDSVTEVEDKAPETTEKTSEKETQPLKSIQKLADVAPIEDIVAFADQHLTAGNYGVAIRSYLKCIKNDKQGLVLDPHLLLRIAYSQELIGETQDAKAAYREIIGVARNLKHLRIATCGLARVESELGNQYESINQLSPLLLSQPADKQSMSMEMIRYQWASSLHRRASAAYDVSPEQNDPLNDKLRVSASATLTPAWDFKRPTPEQMLTWIDDANRVEQIEDSQFEEEVQVLQRPTDSTETIGLKLNSSGMSYSQLIQQLQTKTALEFRISKAATNQFAGRSINLRIPSTLLSQLLDHLLVPLGLVWQQDGREILIADAKELSSDALRAEFYLEAAIRALKDFEIRHSDSDFVLDSLMSRATMAMRRGEFDAAANLLREVQRARPQGELLANLFYYLGTINLYYDRRQEGIDYLYQAVDQTRSRQLSSTSYCILSRVHLTDNELELSIRCGRRAFNLAAFDWQRQTATTNLARAYLLDNDPFSANQFIFKAVSDFQGESSERAVVAMLGALSRLDAKQLPDAQRRARVRLLTAVSMAQPADLKSFADCYLAATAFQRLGFPERSLGLLSLALNRPDIGNWQRQISFETAQLEESLNLPKQALRRYQELVDQQDDWKNLALFRIAKIHLDAGEFDKSIAACQLVLDNPDSQEQTDQALAALGNAYRDKGDYKSAALCFAGYDPQKISIK